MVSSNARLYLDVLGSVTRRFAPYKWSDNDMDDGHEFLRLCRVEHDPSGILNPVHMCKG